MGKMGGDSVCKAGRKAKGKEDGKHIVRYLLQNDDDYSERKVILKSTLILKNLKCLINKNIVLLFERHKPNPIPNTIILTNIMAVTTGKHSDSHAEPACFVRRT
jgi:hypothetical protein